MGFLWPFLCFIILKQITYCPLTGNMEACEDHMCKDGVPPCVPWKPVAISKREWTFPRMRAFPSPAKPRIRFTGLRAERR